MRIDLRFLHGARQALSSPPPPHCSYHLLVTNHTLPQCFSALWDQASIRICADGAADRLLQHWREENRDIATQVCPAAVVGDLDSITPATLQQFKQMGAEIVHLADQDSHDLDKSIRTLLRLHRETKPALPPDTHIVVTGCMTGRFDHVLAAVNTLHVFQKLPLILLSDENLACVLPAVDGGCESSDAVGVHENGDGVFHTARAERLKESGGITLVRPSEWSRMKCGLVAMCGPAKVSTSGLKWDMECVEMTTGGLWSTSNEFVAEELTVLSNTPLLFTCNIPPS